jgi:putative oxygen-independent coproporphyrinogen III oxidase
MALATIATCHSSLVSAERLPANDNGPMTSEPRAAYIHVPFCRHRCGYCNFTLVAGRDDLIDRYLIALERELAGLVNPHEVETLFFGGGTPTHLTPAQLKRLFDIVRQWFPLARDAEFSIEANPIDLDEAKSAVLAPAGVTRVSLGAQSFYDWKLNKLERDHDECDIAAAVEFARPFAKSVSLDLIFGVPGESLADWKQDLAAAIALSPEHISTYGLTFEKGTAFWSRLSHGDLSRIDEESERQMYEVAIDTLTAAGYEHYEVSNFARRGHRCRHNENYWLGGQYFAAGPGAARFLGGLRETNHRSTTTYIHRVLTGASPVAESERLGAEDAARERLVFALRRLEGLDRSAFIAATDYSVEQLGGAALPRLIDHGLLEIHGDRLRLTRRGLLVSDAIWPEFLRV